MEVDEHGIFLAVFSSVMLVAFPLNFMSGNVHVQIMNDSIISEIF